MSFRFGLSNSLGLDWSLGSGNLSAGGGGAPAVSAFVSTWNTANVVASTTNDVQIILPLESDGTYNFAVDWGDGNTDNITAYDQAEVTHTYNASGNYTVNITGTIEGWRFGNGGDHDKISNISQWGPLRVGNNNGYFYGCRNMTCNATDTLNLNGTTNAADMFRSCFVFNGDLSLLDTSLVTIMSNMFYNCQAFSSNIALWDTSNNTLMNSMFRGTSNFNQPIGVWDTANVTNMTETFRTSPLDQDLSNWNVEKVVSMLRMWYAGPWPSTANYDAMLISFAAQDVKNTVQWGLVNATHSAGAAATAKDHLVNTHSWIITDGAP